MTPRCGYAAPAIGRRDLPDDLSLAKRLDEHRRRTAARAKMPRRPGRRNTPAGEKRP